MKFKGEYNRRAFDVDISVSRSHTGGVRLFRTGSHMAVLDMSAEEAVGLAMALFVMAGHQRIPTSDGRRLELTP
jgi:hypothetical protein